MIKKVFIVEGIYSKAYIVTRLHDKLECVAKLLKPTIAGIDDDFARGKFSQEILEKKGQTWSNIYRDYESIKGETVFKKKK